MILAYIHSFLCLYMCVTCLGSGESIFWGERRPRKLQQWIDSKDLQWWVDAKQMKNCFVLLSRTHAQVNRCFPSLLSSSSFCMNTTRTVRARCCARNWWSHLCAAYVPCFVFVAVCLTLSWLTVMDRSNSWERSSWFDYKKRWIEVTP
jgi:hypothetical protein